MSRWIAFILLMLLLTSCAPQRMGLIESNPPPLAPTIDPLTIPKKVVAMATRTPASGPGPLPTLTSTPSGPRYHLADTPVSFEVPDGWEPYGDPAWSPGGGHIIFGVRWKKLERGMEIEASLLPAGGVVQGRSELSVNGVPFSRYRIMKETRTGVEADYIARRGEQAYDFYFIAPTFGELDALEPVIEQVLGSIQWE